MHRWTYVASGVMAGIIAVLLAVIVAQNREPQAWAAPMMQQAANPEALQMYTGGAGTNTQDIVWITYKRTAPSKGDDKGGILSKTERITLCCYQVANGARNIKLVAVRDVSFDMDVIEYGNDKPHVKDIIDELKKSEKPK